MFSLLSQSLAQLEGVLQVLHNAVFEKVIITTPQK